MFSGWTPRYGGPAGYSAPPAADQGLQSFRDQHMAQLEQLQRMHQRQMESVLPVGAPVPPRPYYPPRQSYPYPPPYSHNVPPPGYQSPTLPPDTEKPPPPPPTTDQQPPPPPPDGGPPTNTPSLEEQQQFWYKQHLQNLQQKAKSHGREAPPPALETAVPPSSGYVPAPPSQQPPPPPLEDTKPPLPVENVSSGINLSEDPEQAQRLKTLQEAAAHWQQHELHRLGFQYQGIMQKHSAMQQLLQRYQQVVQDPPHLTAMTVDVQLQHYEMQQKQFLPLHQEWENQFKKWQELLQTYPHKDQLHEYQVQWASWQSHIKATKTHLKDKVASLKNLKQQFGGSHYIGGIAMVPPYPAYSPVMSPAVPAALPSGASVQPPYTPPVYGTGPPPSLPPEYPDATPPLPPVTAPPLPPLSSAPPPPPPVTSPSAEVQPPLPPPTDTQPPPPAESSEPPNTASVPKSAQSASDSPPVTAPDSSVVSSAPSMMPPGESDPPTAAESFLPGGNAGLSYQAQQALIKAPLVPSYNPPLAQSAPPVPSYNPLLGQSAPPVPSYNPPLGQSAPPVPSYNPPLTQSAPPVPSYNPPLTQSAPPVPSYNPPLTQSAPPVPSYNPPLTQSAPPVPSYNPPLTQSAPPVPFYPPLAQTAPPVPPYNPPLAQSAPPVPSYNPPLAQSAPPVSSNNPPLAQSAPPGPYHNLPSEAPSPGLEKQSEDTKQSNPPPGPPPVADQELMSTGPPPPAGIKMGGQYEGPRESRFASQGPGFAPPRFPPPGSLGFHSSRPMHDRENQQWTNEQKDPSTPADASKQYGEASSPMVPASRWDRPKDPDQSWDKPKPPHVSQSPAKEMSEYPSGPMSDRESNRPAEMWNRPDGPQFSRRGSQADDVGSKWDQPPDSRWSGSKEPSSDRWSNSQDRWGVENTSSPMDRFGDAQNSGFNRFEGPEVAPYERYGDGMGPPYDRHAAPEVPFRERFGHPEGSQRFRYNAPELQPRGRARFPAIPPRGRFPFPESHPRHQFSAVEGRTPGFGYPETLSRDRFGGPELPSDRDHFEGPEEPLPQERFGGFDQPPSQERFGGPELPSYQEDLRDPKMPPSHHRFGGMNVPPSHDRFGGPDVPDRLKGHEFPSSHREHFKGPEMPPTPGDQFKGHEMLPPAGDRFKGPEMTPPGDRFKGPEMGPLGERFKGPEMPSPAEDRFKGPEVLPHVDRFKGPEMLPHVDRFKVPEMLPHSDRFKGPEMLPHGDRFKGPEMLPHGDRFKGPEMLPAGDRFRGPEMLPAGDRFKGPEILPAGDRFKGPEMLPAGDRFKGPEMLPAGDRFKGPEVPLPAGDRFKGPDVPLPAGDRFKGPQMHLPAEDRFKGPEIPPPVGDRFRGNKMPPHQQNRFGDFDGPPGDSWSHDNKKDGFGAAEVVLHDSQENRVPFSDRWGSGDRKGRPEWPRGRGDGGNRPPLLGDSPLERPKIQGNNENIPKESYQNQFKKQVPKEADAHLGANSCPGGQRDAKQEPQDVKTKPDNEPLKEGAPKKAESPAVQESAAPETGTSASPEPHKPEKAAESSKAKTKASDVPKTDPEGGQTSPAPGEASKPLSASSVPSDVTKGPGQTGHKSASEKSDLSSSDLGKPSVSPGPEAAKPHAPAAALSVPKKTEELTEGPSSSRKLEAFPIPSTVKTGGLLPTPTTGIVAHFAPHTNPAFRPQATHLLPSVRPGDPWAPPARPGDPWAPPARPGDPWAPPARPGDPWAPPVRPGGPRAAPPVRMGGPRAAPPVRMGGPRAAPPVRMGGPRAAPPVRMGGPRAAPPVRMGGPRAAPPVRMGGPRAGHPVRPGAPGGVPFSWEEPLERSVQGEDRNVYAPSMGADPMCEDPYDEADEGAMGEKHSHGPEGRHSRPEFPNEEADDADGYLHHEPGRPSGFRKNDLPLEPEPYAEDWPENYDMRFDHRGRGRARGFMRGRPPHHRPGSREMDVLDDRGFEPRGHFPDERPLFREGLNEPPPQFGREPFLREPRMADREHFPLEPPLEMRRREFALEDERLEDWERERYWRARDPELLRDPLLDLYMRDERLPLRPPPLPHDMDIRRDPWYDRYADKDLDRVLNYNRLERPFLFDRDLDRDYPRIPEDLDLPLRDRDWLPTRRPLSPHRPFSPVRARSPLPPLPPIDRYLDDRWRLDRELADRDFRDRGELRIREFAERPLWHEDRDPDLLPERAEMEPKDGGWYPREDRAASEGLNPARLPGDPASAALPDQSALPVGEPGAAGCLALSQRQHEIILKAAQELKMLREQKEQLDNLKSFFGDSQSSDPVGKRASDGQSGLEPLQPPSDVPVTRADQSSSTLGVSVAGRAIGAPFSGLWEEDRRGPNSSGPPVGSKLSGIQQTVDYAHGRDLGIGKVEQTPYGERVMLLPEPDRGGMLPYQKDYLIDSFDLDFRDRDPYYERMKSADRRDYERDRSDTHRDRVDHERDRDRHSRDERSSYRDKESSSRRGASDKPPYDRKVDRSGYEVPPPSYGGSRRSYPEERPVIAPPMSAPPPEKKPETKNVDDLLKRPGRDSRPDRIVVIMRGLPGSGKTHVAKLIRDKEVEYGGSAPRVLSLDDYFITEVEKVEKDPESGKKVKRKAMEYEYEPEMEETYRSGMLKTFKKTLDDGFFPFIILDSIHDRVRHFEQFWSAAKTKGFEVYLAEITGDTQTCAKRNVHSRKLKDINKMADNWEPAPRHMIRLDIRSLLQDAAIEEVEMEDSEPSVEPQKDEKKEAAEDDDNDRGYFPKSKWEMDTSEAKLDKLDGLKVKKRKRGYESVASRMEDYLQLPDDYDTRESEPGKKRVRWADLEEKKDADRKRAIGFVVGQTDWDKITDKSGHLAERALNRTKYI